MISVKVISYILTLNKLILNLYEEVHELVQPGTLGIRKSNAEELTL